VELAPRAPAPQTGGRPGAEIEEAVEGAADALGLEGPVALDGHERVVADALALPERLHRHQNEIGAAKGQPTNAWCAHALRRQM
jgi:hypothetical protein